MRKLTPVWMITSALALGLASCSSTPDKKPSEQPDLRLVGRVASVPEKRGFVLIESYGSWALPDGTYLLAGGGERQASLFTTGEKLGQFVAADVKSGTVQSGDGVYYREKLKPQPKTDTPSAGEQKPAGEGGKPSPAEPVAPTTEGQGSPATGGEAPIAAPSAP